MKRIIIHWSGGTGQPSNVDYEHYHFMINCDGLVINGKYKPEDNQNCRDGKYAKHTGGGNTGSIGISMCGMFVPKNEDIHKTKYPLTKIQCEKTFLLIAELSKQYNISITPQNIMTHYEFGLKNPNTTSAGKIDIIYLPPYPWVQKNDIGDFIRNKARWYLRTF